MSLRDELMNIRAKRGGLTPTMVVEEARPKSHPLHDRFEWDNRIAGDKWRETQASELIRSVRVSFERSDGSRGDLREFHAVRSDESSPSCLYEPVGEIIGNQMMTELLRRDMQRDWRALKQRYDVFEEFRQMVRSDLQASS